MSPSDAAVAQAQQAQHMLKLLGGFQVSQALYVAAKLGVPDALAAGPLDTVLLAERVGAAPERLYRVLRTLAAMSVFVESPHNVFSNTPLSETLRTPSDGCASVRSMAITLHETHYQPFDHLLEITKGSSKTGFDLAYGKPAFEHLAEDKDRFSIFADAMKSMTAGARGPIEQHLEPDVLAGEGDIICDVGGGNGHVAAQVLGVRPNASAIVVDLPHIEPVCAAFFKGAGLADRCKFVGTDFFKEASIPPDAALYFLGFVLHDWTDDECVTILRNIRAAMRPSSRLAIAEMIVGGLNEPGPAKQLDLTMLGIVSGRERTSDEYRLLLDKVGLKLTKVIDTGRPVSLIMCDPVSSE